jgi:hypothetical protein
MGITWQKRKKDLMQGIMKNKMPTKVGNILKNKMPHHLQRTDLV